MAGIVKFKTDAGQDMQLTAKDVTDLVCPQATPKEVELFLRYCSAHRLDPIGTKDAYLIKYGSQPASMVTGYQVFNRRAKSFKSYRGIKSGVVVERGGKVEHKQGSAVYRQLGETLIGGWAEVYVDGWEAPVYNEVALSDYSTGKSNWQKMPGVMIEKVSKANAWRTAYPDEFGGMYTSEEMEQAGGDSKPEQPAYADPTPIKHIFEPFAMAAHPEVGDKRGRYAAAQADILAEVKGTDMHMLTESQVRRAVSFMEEAIAAANRAQEAERDAYAGDAEAVAADSYEYEETF